MKGGRSDTRKVDGGRTETELCFRVDAAALVSLSAGRQTPRVHSSHKLAAIFPLSHKTRTNAASRGPAVPAKRHRLEPSRIRL